MLTKEDLKAIKDILQLNNKILTTIFKVELGEVKNELAKTNKRLTAVHTELKTEIKNVHTEQKSEIKDSEKRLGKKIDKLNYAERIDQLEKHVQTLTSS